MTQHVGNATGNDVSFRRGGLNNRMYSLSVLETGRPSPRASRAASSPGPAASPLDSESVSRGLTCSYISPLLSLRHLFMSISLLAVSPISPNNTGFIFQLVQSFHFAFF